MMHLFPIDRVLMKVREKVLYIVILFVYKFKRILNFFPFRKSQENQKEMKLLLDMYKGSAKEQRDKVQVRQIEKVSNLSTSCTVHLCQSSLCSKVVVFRVIT